MPTWHQPFVLLAIASWFIAANAQVTVYGVEGVVTTTTTITTTSSAATGSYTGAAAWNPTTLVAPAVPTPAPAMQFPVQLQNSASDVSGLSIPQTGAFLGFSIEMSVIDQVSKCPVSSFEYLLLRF